MPHYEDRQLPPGSYENQTELRRSNFHRSLENRGVAEHTIAMTRGLLQQTFRDNQLTVPAFTLREYFSQNLVLEIPKWQREYTWEPTDEGQVGILLADLKAFVDDESQNEYLLGAVIVCNSANSQKVLLIDGQQRTVTLSLLLMACEEFLSHSDLYTQNEYKFKTDINSMINFDDQHHSFNPRVVWAQENANKILVKIYDWMRAQDEDRDEILNETDKLSKTQSNLLAALKFIRDEIREGKWIEHQKLIPSLKKIFGGIRIIQLRLGEEKEAQRAFDRINHRGMQLSDADLVKNLIFQNVDDSDFEAISDSWVSMTDTLREIKSSKLSDPKFLLRAHAWINWEKKHGYDDLADLYRDSAFMKKANARDFAMDLEKYANFLKDYARELSHQRHGALPLLLPCAFLGSVQHYSVLLAGSAISSKESFGLLYRQVALRSLQYIFAKERPPEFETMIPKWANAVRAGGKDIGVETLTEIFEEKAFGDNPESKKQFLIESLDNQMRTWNYSESSGKKKIRTALALLSWWVDSLNDTHYPISEYFSTKKPRGARGSKGWDLDHIYPKKLENAKISDDLRNSIGNLALLGPEDNRDASNATPAEKAGIYRHSHLVFTKTIVGEELTPRMEKGLNQIYELCNFKPQWEIKTWNEQDISQRTDFLISFMQKIVQLKIDIP